MSTLRTTENVPVVSEWFGEESGTGAQWRHHFVVRAPADTMINWYRALGWVKRSWPLPRLEDVTGGSRLNDPSDVSSGVTSGSLQTETGRDLNATDPNPLEVESKEVCLRQLKATSSSPSTGLPNTSGTARREKEQATSAGISTIGSSQKCGRWPATDSSSNICFPL